MRRRRLTWKDNSRKASLPNEGQSHPADIGQQPKEKYFIDNDGNGVGSEPSDFAEDVHEGPYENGAEPALPNEGYDHPAMKQAARDIRASVERKASKCIRIAQATLGKGASIDSIEDQALAFMNMADADVDATLNRLAEEEEAYMMGEEEEATSMFAQEDAELEALMAEFMADDHEGEEEAEMLSEMLADDEEAEEEAMLAEMLAEMEADQNDPEHFMAQEEEAQEEEAMEDLMLAEEDHDAMGLGDEMMEDDILAGLFAEKMASDDEEEEKDEEEEEKEEKEEAEESDEEEKADKKASRLRPRARKASKGVKTLGKVSKAASSELSDLSKLWSSAPDIKDLF